MAKPEKPPPMIITGIRGSSVIDMMVDCRGEECASYIAGEASA